MKKITVIIIALFLTTALFAQEGTQQNDPANPQTDTQQPAQSAQPVDTPIQVPETKPSVNIYGKIRYRFQYQQHDQDNIDGTNEEENRERQRIRVYLGVNAEISKNVQAGVQLSTGSRQSHNSTLGDEGPFMDLKSISILKAYITFNFLDNMLKLHFGKFKNPMHSAGLVMTGEINPEGLAQQIKIKFSNMAIGLNLGEYVYQQYNGVNDENRFSKWILAPQLYWQAKFGNVSLVLAPGFYLWTHRDPNDAVSGSADDPYQYHVKYNVFDLYFEIKINLGNLPLKIKGEFAYNLSKPENTFGISGGNYLESHRKAFLVEVSLGKTKKQWDWIVKAGYVTIQRYALDPHLTNSDFVEFSYDNSAGVGNKLMNRIKYGIYGDFGIIILPNTKLDLFFLYYSTQNIGYDVAALAGKQYDRDGWVVKLSLDVKF